VYSVHRSCRLSTKLSGVAGARSRAFPSHRDGSDHLLLHLKESHVPIYISRELSTDASLLLEGAGRRRLLVLCDRRCPTGAASKTHEYLSLVGMRLQAPMLWRSQECLHVSSPGEACSYFN
jgi:hypothetical protein